MLEKLGTNYFPGEKFTTQGAIKMANMIIHALQNPKRIKKDVDASHILYK